MDIIKILFIIDQAFKDLALSAKTGDEIKQMAKDHLPSTIYGQLQLSDMLYEKITNLELQDSDKNEVFYLSSQPFTIDSETNPRTT